MPRPFLITFCGLLLTLAAFSCDITLPAFAAMSRDLAAPIELVQAIVPVFLIAQGIGQLLFGPGSDRFGRRPVILLGLMVYLVGTAIALSAPTIVAVHVGRVLQGLGSACGVVVARAVLRDTHQGVELARAMSLAMAIFAFGPIFAPLLGYTLIAAGSWRYVFVGMGVFVAGLLAACLVGFRETHLSPDLEALRPARLFAAYRRVLTHRQSGVFLLLLCIVHFSIVSFVANSPRFYRSAFGIEGMAFAVLFAVNGLAIIAGQFVNRRLISRFSVLASTRVAAAALFAVAAAVTALTAADRIGLPVFVVLMFIYNASFLVVMANAMSQVIDPHHDIAGVASALAGFLPQIVSSLLAILTFPVFRGELLPWISAVLVVTAVVLATVLAYRPQAMSPAPAART